MKTEYPLVSIIIATFNSSRALELVLDSISKQTYPRKYMEILIIDGGSKDTTLTIAKKFHCKIIHNIRVEPIYAKYLGYMYAKGKYMTYIDHDEVILNANSIMNKVNALKENTSVKAAIGSGYKNPEGYNIVNGYINEFGEPFSFFIYRLTKNADFFFTTMGKRYKIARDTKTYSIFDLSTSSKIPIIELGAAGGMIDREFIKKEYDSIIKRNLYIPYLLHLFPPEYSLLAIMKDDALLHYSSDNFRGYMKKIIWRIRNNIFFTKTTGTSGYTGRESYQPFLFRLKKYFFLPYAFSFVFPCIDALYLIVTRKNAAYSIHVPLTFITASLILYYWLLKCIGIKPSLTSYDGSTVVYGKK